MDYYLRVTVHGLLFTVYCSWITIHGLLFMDYCSSQYKNCIATQFPAIQSLLQYNFVLQLNLDYSRNTISWPNQPLAIQLLILQYNFPTAHSFSAIQYSVLQYTFQPSSLPLCNTKMVLQYKFFFSTIFPALSLAIQLQGLQYKFTIQLGSSPKTVLH